MSSDDHITHEVVDSDAFFDSPSLSNKGGFEILSISDDGAPTARRLGLVGIGAYSTVIIWPVEFQVAAGARMRCTRTVRGCTIEAGNRSRGLFWGLVCDDRNSGGASTTVVL